MQKIAVIFSSEIRRFAAVKPVHAFIRGEGCSAAYHIACCAKSITAAGGALVGSIGCYILTYDYSEFIQREGIRAVLLKSGPNKGTGAVGTKITADQESRLQGIVDSIAGNFFKTVSQARGLSMDDVATWGDGGYWTAEDGLKLKLVDRICDWSTFLSQTSAADSVATNNPKGDDSMSTKVEKTESNEPTAATVKELKKAFPKASSDFIVAQLEKGATLDSAKTEYIAFLESKLEKSGDDEDDEDSKKSKKKSKSEDDEDDDEKDKKKSSKKSKSEDDEDEDEDDEDSKKSKTAGSLGNKPHAQGGKQKIGQSATDQWKEAIAEKMSQGISKESAVKAVVAEHPELHEAYVNEFNANAKEKTKR